MSELKAVILVFKDHTKRIEGEEALKWQRHNKAVADFAEIHNNNPFQSDPIVWKEFKNFYCWDVSVGEAQCHKQCEDCNNINSN